MVDKNLILYALNPVELTSMGKGKFGAQAMHAQALFLKNELIDLLRNGMIPGEDVEAWCAQTDQGFGTTLTIDIPDFDVMGQVIDAAQRLNISADMVIDPTYPYHIDTEFVRLIEPGRHSLPPIKQKGGKSACFRAQPTVGYIFGDKSELSVLLARFNLVPND